MRRWHVGVFMMGAFWTLYTGEPARADCGNHVVEVDAGEECDDGGVCLGGSNAGQQCTNEADCFGDGVCNGGTRASMACSSDFQCPNARCMHCVAQGGDGCAANCTFETAVSFALKEGVVVDDTAIETNTSGAVVHGEALTIPFPLKGMQTFLAGKERDGIIPLVIKAASVQFPKINAFGFACGCVRGVAAKTCGGSAFTKDGVPAVDCTPGYTAGESLCPVDKPCVFVHGPGNSATGAVGCDGLDGVNVFFTQDDLPGGSACTTAAECPSAACIADVRHPGQQVCAPLAPTMTLSDSGAPGSALLLNSTAIGTVQGACPSTFCTESDPFSARGVIHTLPLTTGRASAQFTNANGIADNTICDCASGENACAASSCQGPLSVAGGPLDCNALSSGRAPGGALASSFTAPGLSSVQDAVITAVFVATGGGVINSTPTATASPTATPSPTVSATPCVGDCNTSGKVTVDEVLTMVNIALGYQGAACMAGDANHDTKITVDEILTAVNNALGACGTAT